MAMKLRLVNTQLSKVKISRDLLEQKNYTEERIKDRILNKEKEIGNIIDIKNSQKAKSSKGYEHWATKHNLKTAASTLVEIRNKGFKSMEELECGISRISIKKMT